MSEIPDEWGVDPDKTLRRHMKQFWGRVQKNGGNACWQWLGPLQTQGYGVIRVCGKRKQAKQLLAHRVAWEVERGPVPEDFLVSHDCNNRGCVRPDHLYIANRVEFQKRTKGKALLRTWREFPFSIFPTFRLGPDVEVRKDGSVSVSAAIQDRLAALHKENDELRARGVTTGATNRVPPEIKQALADQSRALADQGQLLHHQLVAVDQLAEAHRSLQQEIGQIRVAIEQLEIPQPAALPAPVPAPPDDELPPPDFGLSEAFLKVLPKATFTPDTTSEKLLATVLHALDDDAKALYTLLLRFRDEQPDNHNPLTFADWARDHLP